MFVILVQEACDCAKRRETTKKKKKQYGFHTFIYFNPKLLT